MLCYQLDGTFANGGNKGVFVLDHHHEHLQSSGLSDETIMAAGIWTAVHPEPVGEILGWARSQKRLVPSLVFPYRGVNGSSGYARIKLDRPLIIGGKPAKYLSPKGRANEIYLPPGVIDLLQQVDVPLCVTEGEKKSLKATQEKFPCIGLVGVYGWKDGRSERLLPALERSCVEETTGIYRLRFGWRG